MSEEARSAIARAKARLDRLDLYPEPVRVERVRVRTAPWLFRLPRLRRFDGFTAYSTIFLRRPVGETSDDLVTHELCHVWQMQHRPLLMPLSFVRYGYWKNPYEVEARRAAERTRM